MATRARRAGILLNRLHRFVDESSLRRGAQRRAKTSNSFSRINGLTSSWFGSGSPPTVVAAELKEGIARLPSEGAGWKALDPQGRNRAGLSFFFRQASTDQSSQAAPDSAQGEQPKKDAQEAKGADEEEEVDEKTKTLRAALSHVPKLGWTEAAIAAGARDVGLSPAIAGAFPRKEAALVEFFMDECTQALVEELESREEELGKMVLQDRIATIVWVRLEMQVPYLSKWAQALSIQANPVNLPTTLKQRALLIDEIWHTAGDRSADMDWYAKRAILAGVYSTTELYMLRDISPGFRDSRAFLERRINDALDCRKTVKEAEHLAQAVGAGLQNTFNSFLKRSRPSGF